MECYEIIPYSCKVWQLSDPMAFDCQPNGTTNKNKRTIRLPERLPHNPLQPRKLEHQGWATCWAANTHTHTHTHTYPPQESSKGKLSFISQCQWRCATKRAWFGDDDVVAWWVRVSGRQELWVSKAPDPQLLPGRSSINGCPLLRGLCVCTLDG